MAAANQNPGQLQVEPGTNALPLKAKNPSESPDKATAPQRVGDIFAKARSYTKAHEAMAAGLYPYFLPIEGSEATEVVAQGKRRVMIGSNNYLGLTHDPRVVEAAQAAIHKYGSGCTGSRFLNGNTDLHEQLEVELAALTKKQSALVFSTGYQANLGVISGLVGRSDVCFIDKLDHASIVDGCSMSYGATHRFRHRDLNDLDEQLSRTDAAKGKLIAVD